MAQNLEKLLRVNTIPAAVCMAFLLLFFSFLPNLNTCALPVGQSERKEEASDRKRRNTLAVLAITAVYAAAAFWNLGNTSSPESFLLMAGNSVVLPPLSDTVPAKLMLFSGDKFTAAEAKELGVLQFVYPREELMDKAMELAEKFASKGPRSITAAKEVMAVARQSVVGASLVQENITGKLIRGSYDAGEGIRALKEKRQPKFENR